MIRDRFLALVRLILVIHGEIGSPFLLNVEVNDVAMLNDML